MNTAVKWTLITTAIVVAGYAGYKIYQKQKAKKNKELPADGGSSSSSTSSGGGIYTGLSKEQTLKLQQRINAFLASGSLSGYLQGFANIGSSIGNSAVANMPTSNMVYTATSPIDISVIAKGAKNIYDAATAFQTFKNTILQPLVEDGIYGSATMTAVSALQVYLNTTKDAGLKVDGKYGPNTDAATGWKICS